MNNYGQPKIEPVQRGYVGFDQLAQRVGMYSGTLAQMRVDGKLPDVFLKDYYMKGDMTKVRYIVHEHDVETVREALRQKEIADARKNPFAGWIDSKTLSALLGCSVVELHVFRYTKFWPKEAVSWAPSTKKIGQKNRRLYDPSYLDIIEQAYSKYQNHLKTKGDFITDNKLVSVTEIAKALKVSNFAITGRLASSSKWPHAKFPMQLHPSPATGKDARYFPSDIIPELLNIYGQGAIYDNKSTKVRNGASTETAGPEAERRAKPRTGNPPEQKQSDATSAPEANATSGLTWAMVAKSVADFVDAKREERPTKTVYADEVINWIARTKL